MSPRALCAIATFLLATLGIGVASARAEVAIDAVVGGISIRF